MRYSKGKNALLPVPIMNEQMYTKKNHFTKGNRPKAKFVPGTGKAAFSSLSFVSPFLQGKNVIRYKLFHTH